MSNSSHSHSPSSSSSSSQPQDKERYFGHPIEPFSTKYDRALGTFDSQGHFLFKHKKADPWLDSLNNCPLSKPDKKITRKLQAKGDEKKASQYNELELKDLAELLADLLPQDKSAAEYIKELKKESGSKQEMEMVLELISSLISKSNDYSVPTLKRQQLLLLE